MAEYEKDYVLRQTKLMVKGLGAFLDKDSVDEILSLDQEDSDKDLERKQQSDEQKMKANEKKQSKE
ncbi:hypothetical protein BAU15_01310 [Enterococcus sp. JM4C]|uniref:hypothetical protein n=1 Tax=Candidatus Enterococcus huntleyi TaxID=1857217 RepID=UPI00137B3902|nr:hypothetical protein [Enterococcus sp. JM4C]KAF1299313.1 hypothetical protein BAU15_01310 [Enterococcus sp. JM4C]